MKQTGVIGLLLVMMAFACASGVRAADENWKYFGSDQKGDRFFYDASSVIPAGAGPVQVWTRELTSEGAAKRLQEINCSYKIIRDLQVIYEGRQKPQLRPRVPSSWRAMEQDPVTTELYKALCR